MPVRRRDGEIVDETTAPVRPRDRAGAADAADAPTDPLLAQEKGKDSLFGDPGGSLEEPTVPMRNVGDDGETRILPPRRRQQATDAQTELPDDPMLDPPVGWLVVVRGPGKGRVLTLGNGMNVMGRGPDCRVRIDFGDDTIARANHARLVYEPRQRRYLLNHGDGANLTYLNGNVVMGSATVQPGAMIEVGETTLRFQPLCSAAFDWPDVDD